MKQFCCVISAVVSMTQFLVHVHPHTKYLLGKLSLKKKSMATKFEEGGGGKALVAGPLKKHRFLRLPLPDQVFLKKLGYQGRKNLEVSHVKKM